MTSQYGGMFGSIPPAILPNGQESLSGMRQLMQVAGAFGRSGGPGFSMSMAGLVPLPPDRLIIYGKIRDDDSSSSSVSTSSSDSTACYFYDNDGYLAYCFDEVNPFWPWKGEVMEGGIKTTEPAEVSSSSTRVQGGGNFAYPLNGETLNAGTIVALLRAGEHWIIVGVNGGSGGQSACFEIDCAAGTIIVTSCGSTTGGTTSSTTDTSSSTGRISSSSSDGTVTRDAGTSSSTASETL